MSSWEESALATSMMMVSLGENTVARELSGSSGTLSSLESNRNLNGWGNMVSRQTYRNDLCSLSQHSSVPVNRPVSQPIPQRTNYFNFDLR